MNECEEKKPDGQDKDNVILNLDFAPNWARVSPEEQAQRLRSVHNASDYDDDNYGGRHRDSGRSSYRERRPRSEFDSRSNRRPDRERTRRPSDRDRDRSFDDRSQPPSAPHSDHRPDTASSFEQRDQGGERPRFQRRDYQRPPIPKLPLEIRILPEQSALGSVIRKIQSSHRAFPLRDLAGLFLDNPTSCLVRLETQRDSEEPIQLFQCKICGMPGLNEDEITSHLVTAHMGDFFDVEEVECDPPTGAFVCVARCSISGELLGPPNHHSFNTRLQELLSQRFPNMSEENYRKRIEMVRDPEVVEAWRQQCTHKNIYRLKGAEETKPVEPETKTEEPEPKQVEPEIKPEEPQEESAETTAELVAESAPESSAENTPEDAPESSAESSSEAAQEGATENIEAAATAPEPPPKAPPLEREMAELVYKRDIMPGQIAKMRNLVCTVAVAMQTPNHNLRLVLQDTLRRERRYPASLFFALRGAFRHRKLFLFRANDGRGADFVMFGKPVLLSSDQPVVDSWRALLDSVAAQPGIPKAKLVEDIAGSDEVERRRVLTDLTLLIEKGHIIEYFNSTLTSPTENPFFALPEEQPQSQ